MGIEIRSITRDEVTDFRRVMNDQEILGDYEAALLYLKLYKASLGPEIPDVLQEAFKDHFMRYQRQVRIIEERRERERERRLLDEDSPSDRRWSPPILTAPACCARPPVRAASRRSLRRRPAGLPFARRAV